MKKWYRIEAKKDRTAEILIYEQIGKNYWDDSGVSAKEFVKELNALDVDTITLRINSPGGNVFEGNVIYNALRAHPAEVDVHIDGIAASIASVIAMAGDTINIPENGMIMIHDPSGGTWGTSADMRKTAEALDKIKIGIIAAYRGKTDLENDTLAEMMTEETWMTAEEAVEQGFADVVGEPTHATAHFSQLKNFKNTPERLFAAQAVNPPNNKEPLGETNMADKNDNNDITIDFIRAHHPDIVQAFIKEGATAEQNRIKGVMALTKEDMSDEIKDMLFDGKSTDGDVAVAILAAQKDTPPAKPAPTAAEAAAADLAADGAAIPVVDNSTGDDVQAETELQGFFENIQAGAAQK